MANKHSKAPWKISKSDKDGYREINSPASGWFSFATVVVKLKEEEFDNAQGVANCKLIAAAPDLLEACQNLENDNDSIPEHAWAKLQEAIRKATI